MEFVSGDFFDKGVVASEDFASLGKMCKKYCKSSCHFYTGRARLTGFSCSPHLEVCTGTQEACRVKVRW